MPIVHPTAIIGPAVELADDVQIGPYCIVGNMGARVTLGPGVRLISHVCIEGPAAIGAGTTVYPNASLGFGPQDYKFKPGMTTAGIVLGEHCIIREHATVHAASKAERPTTLGDRVFMMVNSHVGHDAIVHNDVILVNNSALAGHTEIFDKAILSGGVVVHQFCRIGRMVMCSGGTVVTNDVPPFCMAAHRNTLVGLNLVGLRRSGMPRTEIDAVKRAYREVLRRNPPRAELLAQLAERGKDSPAVQLLHDFVQSTKRSITPVGGRRTRPASNAPEEGYE